MGTEVAASQSQSTKKTQSNLAKALKWAREAIGILTDQSLLVTGRSVSPGGTVVAAGGNIVPVLTVTVGISGIFEVEAWGSWIAAPGSVTPRLAVGPHGGPLTVVAASVANSLTQGGWSSVVRVTPGVLPGAQVDFAFTTSVGDVAATFGTVGLGSGAGVRVEETFS